MRFGPVALLEACCCLGPTGVGKTEFVSKRPLTLFFDRGGAVRFDMSPMEPHSVSRWLDWPPPGYVGYEKGGQLTEGVRRRPYQVVLLDEIEKAHPDVLNILLQLLDEGRLTDGRGRAVDFSNCVIVMTSNLGSSAFSERNSGPRIGFGQTVSDNDVNQTVIDRAREHFPPELWNRIDERLVFQPLAKREVAQIATLQLRSTALRLRDENAIELVFGDGVVPWLVDNGGYDPEFGARPMRQTIERKVEAAVARLVISGAATSGDRIFVDVQDGELTMRAEA
ncbi:MAG: AAA family ATPase [bacterium]